MNVPGRRQSVGVSIFLALWAMTAPNPAKAGFIATDLGSGGSYNTTSGYTLAGPQSSSGLGYGLAVEFTVSGSSSIAFGSAQLALEYHGGANAVDILLMADNSGLPGSTLETIHLTGIAAGPSLVTATSTAHTLLAPGTNYWLAAVASNDTYMSWMANSQGQMNHLAYRTDHGAGPSSWGTAPGNADVAFSIATAAVPAPPSFALLGVGLLGLAGYHFGRRRPG